MKPAGGERRQPISGHAEMGAAAGRWRVRGRLPGGSRAVGIAVAVASMVAVAVAVGPLAGAAAEPAAEVAPAAPGVILAPAEGDLVRGMEFTVGFPAPMIEPDKVGMGDAEPPLKIEPPLRGLFVWTSPSEATFEVEESPAPGQVYTFAVGGQTWSFAAPALRVTADAYDRDRLAAQPRIDLEANYPVRYSEAAERVYFQDRATGARFPAEIEIGPEAPADAGTEFTAVPREPLPVGATVDLVVDGLADAAHGVPAPYLRVFRLGTTRPLGVQWVGAFNWPLGAPLIRIKFDERVDPESATADAVAVEPPVPGLKIESFEDEIVVTGTFDTAVRYRLAIGPNIGGMRGFAMAKAERWGATFRPKKPAIVFPGADFSQRAAGGLRFAFVQVNTGPLHWRLARVPPPLLAGVTARLREFTRDAADPLTGGEVIDPATGDPRPRPTELLVDAFQLEVVASGDCPASGDDRDTVRQLAVTPDRPLAGLHLIEVSGALADGRVIGNRLLIGFGDLLMTRKDNAQETLVRWVQMADGQPVPNLPVRLITDDHHTLARATTDAQGIARFARAVAATATYCVAEPTTGPVYQRAEGDRLNSVYLGEPRPATPAPVLRSVIVLDRNLYRPGETVKLHGMLRTDNGGRLALPKARRVRWEIGVGYRGRTVGAGEVELTADGSWSAEWAIPANAQLCSYSATCTVLEPGADGRAESGLSANQDEYFRVEEYRVPPFSVVLEPVAADGPTGRVNLSSTFFNGAPNAGATVRWTALWVTDDYSGFANENGAADGGGGDDGEQFGRLDARSEGREAVPQFEMETEGEATLGPDGKVTVACEPPFTDGRPRGRCAVRWTAEVTSRDGQTIAGGCLAKVQLAPAIIGVKAADFVAGEEIPVTVAAIDRTDRRVDGVAVHTELLRKSHRTVREELGPFVHRYSNTTIYEKCGEQDGVTPFAGTLSAFAAGDYVVVAEVPGRADVPPVSTEVTVAGDAADYPVESDYGLDLELAKDRYRPGETATLIVKAPTPGVAWVTVETDRVLDTITAPLTGNAAGIPLPVKPEYFPNATVTVYLLRPGAAAGLPGERFGRVELKVSRPDLELALKPTTDQPRVRPGEKVTGRVAVTSEGRPVAGADCVVFAVDDAVLELGDWSPPDCLATFYPGRSHQVVTYGALGDYRETFPADSLCQKGFVIGDGDLEGGPGNVRLRKEFKTLAFWQSRVKSDSAGMIPFAFAAPDNLTAYRIVAVGQTRQHQFGAGSATVEISKPILCEPALPRFLRAGDALDLRAVVRAEASDPTAIAVTCAAEGLELADAKPARQNVSRDRPAAFTFRARVADVPSAKVRFSAAAAGGDGDAVELTLPVLPPVTLRQETVAGYGVPALPPAWRAIQGEIDLALSTSQWFPKTAGLPLILDYPHGCFEQISSRTLAYSLLGRLLGGLPAAPARDAEYRAAVAAGIKQFAQGFRDDGLLPYWGGGNTGSPFVTALAAWAVAEAAQAGFEVSPELRDKCLRGLRAALAHGTPTERAFALMIAAGDGGSDNAAEVAEDLYLHRESLGREGRAMLAVALHRLEIMADEKARLLAEIDRPAEQRAFDPQLLSSPAREDAMVAYAFQTVAPEKKWGREQMRALLDSSLALSTQENLWLLLGFQATVAGEQPRPLALGQTKPDAVSPDRTAALWRAFAPGDFPALPKGEFAWQLTARYRPAADDRAPVNRGFQIERVARNLSGEGRRPLRIGDRVLITYRLRSDRRHHFLALEDPLPAGLEVVNPDLPAVAKVYDLPPAADGRELWLSHSAIRDDRVVLYFDRFDPGAGTYSILARATAAGSFHWPAAQIAPMYDARFSGATAPEKCEIEDQQ